LPTNSTEADYLLKQIVITNVDAPDAKLIVLRKALQAGADVVAASIASAAGQLCHTDAI
jgi:hypothetical protein